jgi:hypothetical protein
MKTLPMSGSLRRVAGALLLVLALQLLPRGSQAQPHEVDVYLFWQTGCVHCERAIGYLAALETRAPDVRVRYLELRSDANRRLYGVATERLELQRLAVPLTVVGDAGVLGYLNEETTGRQIDALVADCRRSACDNVLSSADAELSPSDDRELALSKLPTDAATDRLSPDDQPIERQTLRWLGDADLRSLPLPLLTIVLGALDGFNPCAMWVLILLIGLLLGLQDAARRWLLGLAFLLTSAVVYYVMIGAWLGALLVLGIVAWIRIALGIVAIAGGAYYLHQYFRNPEALCHIANEAKRKRITARLRSAAAEPRFWSAVAAIVVLAAGVNLVELLCSAGIPAVYTQILALTPMPTWQYYAWLALYVLVFLLDDIAIFVVAMLTLELTGGTGRFAHYAQLVGGIILLIVGALLVLRPEWLRF